MSETYAAFLRGINVGGHRKLPMAELRSAMEDVGFASVGTYVASGNVVFVADETDRAGLIASIETTIAKTWGYEDIPVMVRSHQELVDAFQASPYLDSDVDPKNRFVGLLSDAPTPEIVADIDGEALAPDLFAVEGDHVHVLLPSGASKSKLTTNYLESRLGVRATLRNHRTIEKVIALTEERV